MKRRSLLLVPLALALMPGAAFAEKLSLGEISAYINSLKAAETEFVQTNADGTVSTGKLILRRPNRLRFEYDAPQRALVLASAGNVAIFDDKSKEPPEQYPLKRTPLNLILGENVDLTRARMVTNHQEVGGATIVTAQDPDHPEYGTIALAFLPGPRLAEWVITDDLGQETRVQLGDLRLGADYPPSLFAIDREMEKRGLKAKD